MMKGTIIHDKKLGFYPKSNGKSMRQERTKKETTWSLDKKLC